MKKKTKTHKARARGSEFVSGPREEEQLGRGSLIAPDFFSVNLRRRKDGKWNFTYTERLLDTPANRALVANTKTMLESLPNVDFSRKYSPLGFRFSFVGIDLQRASDFIFAEFMAWSSISKLTIGHLYEGFVRGKIPAKPEATK